MAADDTRTDVRAGLVGTDLDAVRAIRAVRQRTPEGLRAAQSAGAGARVPGEGGVRAYNEEETAACDDGAERDSAVGRAKAGEGRGGGLELRMSEKTEQRTRKVKRYDGKMEDEQYRVPTGRLRL